MYIVISKDGGIPRALAPMWCLAFYRAFRSELWRTGIKRDPKPGDIVHGVKIHSLEI